MMIHLWGYIYSLVGAYQGAKVLPSSVTNVLRLSNVGEEESLGFNDANYTQFLWDGQEVILGPSSDPSTLNHSSWSQTSLLI